MLKFLLDLTGLKTCEVLTMLNDMSIEVRVIIEIIYLAINE